MKILKIPKDKRYQEQTRIIRLYLWARWMPYAYLRGFWWYIKEILFYYFDNPESLSFCLGMSLGDIQCKKMHWVYSAWEVQELFDAKKKKL